MLYDGGTIAVLPEKKWELSQEVLPNLINMQNPNMQAFFYQMSQEMSNRIMQKDIQKIDYYSRMIQRYGKSGYWNQNANQNGNVSGSPTAFQNAFQANWQNGYQNNMQNGYQNNIQNGYQNNMQNRYQPNGQNSYQNNGQNGVRINGQNGFQNNGQNGMWK